MIRRLYETVATQEKAFLMGHHTSSEAAESIKLTLNKRPAEELYDLTKDPHQMTNLTGKAEAK